MWALRWIQDYKPNTFYDHPGTIGKIAQNPRQPSININLNPNNDLSQRSILILELLGNLLRIIGSPAWKSETQTKMCHRLIHYPGTSGQLSLKSWGSSACKSETQSETMMCHYCYIDLGKGRCSFVLFMCWRVLFEKCHLHTKVHLTKCYRNWDWIHNIFVGDFGVQFDKTFLHMSLHYTETEAVLIGIIFIEPWLISIPAFYFCH